VGRRTISRCNSPVIEKMDSDAPLVETSAQLIPKS
jgi:hypothetical protein